MTSKIDIVAAFFKESIVGGAEKQGHKLSDFTIAIGGVTHSECIHCGNKLTLRAWLENGDLQVEGIGHIFDVPCTGAKTQSH